MAPLREVARMIFKQALADCSIERAMALHVRVQDGSLYLGEESVPLDRLQHIRIVAVGKAAAPMVSSLLSRLPLPSGCDLTGVLIAPEAPAHIPETFRFFAGGHPSPNAASFAGARSALDLLQALPKQDRASTLCIFLISGGASAMMELPLDAAISLEDTAAFHRALVASGASITEINCVRKHFSAIKGGRLALAAHGAMCRSLLISDVPAGHEDALGSGPTLPDTSTVRECREILAHYELLPQFPSAVRQFFESANLPETPKSTELHAEACVLLSANELASAAAHRAEALGWMAVINNTCDDWEYQAAAKYLLDRLRTLRRQHARVCLISAGEVVVRLPNTPSRAAAGIGGRNQQFALYAATLLQPSDGRIAILSAGSDGIDGSSPAAGAVIDETTLDEATQADSSGDDFSTRASALNALAAFNTTPFLAVHGATIMTGPTGQNLRDLRLLLAEY